jgi:hypothetical protein
MRILHAFDDRSHVVQRRMELRPDEAISVPSTIGTVVLCLKGPLWLTQEGEWRDFILVEGASFVSGSTGKIVVSSLDTAGQALVYVPLPGAVSRLRPGLHIDSKTIERAVQKARNARTAEIWRLLKQLSSGFASIPRSLARGLFARATRPSIESGCRGTRPHLRTTDR